MVDVDVNGQQFQIESFERDIMDEHLKKKQQQFAWTEC